MTSEAPKTTYTKEEVDKYVADTEAATNALLTKERDEVKKNISTYKSMGAASVKAQSLFAEVTALLPSVTDESNKKDLEAFVSEYNENKKQDEAFPVVTEARYTITKKTIENENLKKRSAAPPVDDAASKKAKVGEGNPPIPAGTTPAAGTGDKAKPDESKLGALDASKSRLKALQEKHKSEIESTFMVTTQDNGISTTTQWSVLK
jgi:hypothetical protein